jgi:PncC family amidohydrolase
MSEVLELRIGSQLCLQKLKLATAESCTGGLIGHRLTNIPGSSDYYLGGIIAYSNDVKVALLDVSWETLEKFGAVSLETVLEMARGVRKALHADIAVSVSGIAGPGGGMPEKPVGTTWIGLSTPEGEWTRVYCFATKRVMNKSHSADAALLMVFDYLAGARNLNADLRGATFRD